MIVSIVSYVLLFLQIINPLNDEPVNKEIIKKLIDYSWQHPQEKAYLHTDRSIYMPGDDIWFKAYLMLGPYQVPDTMSSVLYVELINNGGFLIDKRTLRIRVGLGWGDFQIPENISPGRYILKAYTRYMQNYDPVFHFRKSIIILSNQKEETIKNIAVNNSFF